GDRGQPTLIEIAWANKAALGGKIQNALVRTVHVVIMLRNVGSCQELPTKHNGHGFLCLPMPQSNRLIRQHVTH
ncbi:MAG: hypothetical protein AB1371_11150, partial [Pseudomonadota bacterium]